MEGFVNEIAEDVANSKRLIINKNLPSYKILYGCATPLAGSRVLETNPSSICYLKLQLNENSTNVLENLESIKNNVVTFIYSKIYIMASFEIVSLSV